MDLETARQVYADPTHPDWLAAYKTVQWNDIWYGGAADYRYAYIVEAATGPGGGYSGATNVPRPTSP